MDKDESSVMYVGRQAALDISIGKVGNTLGLNTAAEEGIYLLWQKAGKSWPSVIV